MRVLLLEDTPTDAELIERELRKAGLAFTALRVETRDAFLRALEEFRPDIILSDYKLPDFDGMAALEIVKRDHPGVPVIMVTGAFSDVDAVELLVAGAKDYILKDRLARLGPAVQRALQSEQHARIRRQMEQALLESEARYRRITEGLTDYLYTVRVENGRAVETVQGAACVTVTGYTAEEFAANPNLWIEIVAPEDRDAVTQNAQLILQGTDVPPLEHRILRKDGEMRWVSDTIIMFRDSDGKLLSYDGVIKDITERKQAEAALLRLNRTLRALSAGNHALVHGSDEKSLLQSMCQAVTEGGFVMAWVGYAMHDEKKNVAPMAVSGTGTDYVGTLDITWDDQPLGRGPTGSAIRSGQTQICNDIAHDPRMEPWRGNAAQHGFASSIALPLLEGDAIIGSMTIYAAETDAFGPDQVALLEEMASDLAFGIVSLRTRHERDQAVRERQLYAERLHASLEDALQAIATTVEMRDPYTAGHQRRVADLAVAIARELGLPEEQAHGIRLAGIVHDLGKIRIPAEILSKPGALNDIEYSLIKFHPQAGYDILKGIDFPWPIAQAVRQHHERLDGSGYPQGLKGDAIMLEARILAVADVVEAMTSHRPYRAGLGVEAALGEIRKNQGRFYDSEVVDACLRLFGEKEYRFPAT